MTERTGTPGVETLVLKRLIFEEYIYLYERLCDLASRCAFVYREVPTAGALKDLSKAFAVTTQRLIEDDSQLALLFAQVYAQAIGTTKMQSINELIQGLQPGWRIEHIPEHFTLVQSQEGSACLSWQIPAVNALQATKAALFQANVYAPANPDERRELEELAAQIWATPNLPLLAQVSGYSLAACEHALHHVNSLFEGVHTPEEILHDLLGAIEDREQAIVAEFHKAARDYDELAEED